MGENISNNVATAITNKNVKSVVIRKKRGERRLYVIVPFSEGVRKFVQVQN